MAKPDRVKTRKFSGFEPSDQRNSSIPAVFFSDLLAMIDDLDEMKITLYCMWALQQREGEYRYLLYRDFTGDTAPVHGLSGEALDEALARAVERGTLLTVEVELRDNLERVYFANSPQGRKAVNQIQLGEWQTGALDNPIVILPERPNVYRLYEENIGPLTPMISDDLKDLENDFGGEWVREAIAISVQSEKRNLRYVRGILERWRKEGKNNDEASRRYSQSNQERDEREQGSLGGKYSDFIRR